MVGQYLGVYADVMNLNNIYSDLCIFHGEKSYVY